MESPPTVRIELGPVGQHGGKAEDSETDIADEFSRRSRFDISFQGRSRVLPMCRGTLRAP